MMQAYTEEQRAELIERCKMISSWREKYGDYANVMLPAVEAKELAEIALAALKTEVHSYTFEEDPQPLYTAPPVAALMLPDSWEGIKKMADSESIYHALSALVEDSTNDNGVYVVQAVIEEVKRLNATAPAVPDGWKLVPVEPTKEMLAAVDIGPKTYKALLAAAPEVE